MALRFNCTILVAVLKCEIVIAVHEAMLQFFVAEP
jgi:hypothetical protein